MGGPVADVGGADAAELSQDRRAAVVGEVHSARIPAQLQDDSDRRRRLAIADRRRRRGVRRTRTRREAGTPRPQGAKECAAAVRALADDPRPPEARQLGGSAYWRMPVGDWRILYEPDDETITVLVLKVGRVP
ncbi:type II toxin-antitoxin system RelE/ParE family toxin [Streptomyces sp. NPDC005538]|uniref:type II toxin-antitoxin system RelE family toxin n=1 Tax=Streptomyces sp. NPDC005538 TaxID=3157043 RepID=UPI0033AFBA34